MSDAQDAEGLHPPVCPRCAREWLRPYRFLGGDRAEFVLCAECDSLWWPGEPVAVERARFLDDVVAVRLGMTGNPWHGRVWDDVIEPVAP